MLKALGRLMIVLCFQAFIIGCGQEGGGAEADKTDAEAQGEDANENSDGSSSGEQPTQEAADNQSEAKPEDQPPEDVGGTVRPF